MWIESKNKRGRPKSTIAVLIELDPHFLRADKLDLAGEKNILKGPHGIQERTFWKRDS